MIFIHGIRDIPKKILTKESKFYISYEFLQQSIKYRLNIDNETVVKPNL